MFSPFDKERNSMVYLWEFLKIYAHEHEKDPVIDTIVDPFYPSETVFDHKSDNPHRYTAAGGPVPIQFASRLVPYTSIVPANFYCKNDWDYTWKDLEYMYTFLGLRAVSQQLSIRQILMYRSTPSPSSMSRAPTLPVMLR